MSLSNTAVPKYYGMFREAVIKGETPVCETISMEMSRLYIRGGLTCGNIKIQMSFITMGY